MNLDWRRLKAVVIESDDWGLCAWTPDEQAHRVLADTPVFRSPVGRVYGRSTLESAADVNELGTLLMQFRGGDGFPPVWQANSIMAAPDFERMSPPLFEMAEMPLVDLPELPSRWQRPGLWPQVLRAIDEGWWWPELHGLHHIPVRGWLHALRRGAADARRAHLQQVLVCEAVQAGSEYDPSEPLEQREWNLAGAIERFTRVFGRAPTSFCPPDYRSDDALEAAAERLGLATFQGKTEQAGGVPAPLKRLFNAMRFPETRGARFYLPPRIAFEPRGVAAPGGPSGLDAAHGAARAAWQQGRPAILSTHRANYAHLDESWSQAGRAALRELLTRLTSDGATFLLDFEVRARAERAWSVRPIGARGVLVRYYGVPREPVRFAAPAGVSGVSIAEAQGSGRASASVEQGEVLGAFDPGEYLIEWVRDGAAAGSAHDRSHV